MCWAGVGGPASIGPTDNGANFSLSQMQISCSEHILKDVRHRSTPFRFHWSITDMKWHDMILVTKALGRGYEYSQCTGNCSGDRNGRQSKESKKKKKKIPNKGIVCFSSKGDWDQGWKSRCE